MPGSAHEALVFPSAETVEADPSEPMRSLRSCRACARAITRSTLALFLMTLLLQTRETSPVQSLPETVRIRAPCRPREGARCRARSATELSMQVMAMWPD